MRLGLKHSRKRRREERKNALHTSSSVELLELNITIYKKKRYYELLLLCKHQRFGVRVRIRLFGERRKSLFFNTFYFCTLSAVALLHGFLRPHLILTRMAEKCNSKCNAIQSSAVLCVHMRGPRNSRRTKTLRQREKREKVKNKETKTTRISTRNVG